MCFLFLCENLEQFLSQNDLPEVNESKVLGIFPIVFSQIGIYTFIAANASMRFLETMGSAIYILNPEERILCLAETSYRLWLSFKSSAISKVCLGMSGLLFIYL